MTESCMTESCTCHRSPTEGRLPTGESLAMVAGDETVAALSRRAPATRAVLEALGINHCCGGHLTLAEAAASAGVALPELLRARNDAVTGPA